MLLKTGAPVGNRNAVGHGPPKGSQNNMSRRLWSDALRIAAMRRCDDGSGRKRLLVLADKCFQLALAGDIAAMKEIGDRLDGKAHIDDGAQGMTITLNFRRSPDEVPPRFIEGELDET